VRASLVYIVITVYYWYFLAALDNPLPPPPFPYTVRLLLASLLFFFFFCRSPPSLVSFFLVPVRRPLTADSVLLCAYLPCELKRLHCPSRYRAGAAIVSLTPTPTPIRDLPALLQHTCHQKGSSRSVGSRTGEKESEKKTRIILTTNKGKAH
jgi:hypothetical protein